MEIIEKQVEKTREVPCGYWDNCGNGYYGRDRYASKGVAGTGLGVGLAGTALGLLALGRNGGIGLFGNSSSMPQNVNINAGAGTGGYGYYNYNCAPTSFQAWEKSCEDTLALQKGLYDWALTQQSQRFADRQTIDSEMFGLYKSQVDADFGLYKSTRDAFDVVNATHNRDAFQLYKSQRDADDSIRKELSDLKAQVAINAAIRPYQDKLIQCEIDKAFTAGINYTDRRTCKMIEGRVVLPNTPTVTGFGSYCCCSSNAATAAND